MYVLHFVTRFFDQQALCHSGLMVCAWLTFMSELLAVIACKLKLNLRICWISKAFCGVPRCKVLANARFWSCHTVLKLANLAGQGYTWSLYPVWNYPDVLSIPLPFFGFLDFRNDFILVSNMLYELSFFGWLILKSNPKPDTCRILNPGKRGIKISGWRV